MYLLFLRDLKFLSLISYCSGFQSVCWFCFSEGIWQCLGTFLLVTAGDEVKCYWHVVGRDQEAAQYLVLHRTVPYNRQLVSPLSLTKKPFFNLSKDRRQADSGSINWSKIWSSTLVFSQNKLNYTVSGF